MLAYDARQRIARRPHSAAIIAIAGVLTFSTPAASHAASMDNGTFANALLAENVNIVRTSMAGGFCVLLGAAAFVAAGGSGIGAPAAPIAAGKGCAVGILASEIVGTLLGIGMAAYGAVEDQGNRVAGGEGFFSAFSGRGSDGETTVQYAGTRVGGIIQGGYNGDENGEAFGGTFAGTINRSGAVSGLYDSADGEQGSFSGQGTPDLSQVWGSAGCTANCPDDN